MPLSSISKLRSFGFATLVFFSGAVYCPDQIIVYNHAHLLIGIEVSSGDWLCHGTTRKSFVL
jgi:hypothetical protein